MVVLSFLSLGTIEAQQDVTHFSSEDIFEIPAVNGIIGFSVNGTYAEAVLEKDTWVFSDLSLSGSRYSGTLRFSAKDCNVSIRSFRSNALSYSVDGVGEQIMNLGLNLSRTSHSSEWYVINQNSEFFAAGRDWQLLTDNTVVIDGIVGTLTVVHYNYGYQVDNRPFYMQHSIIILTGVAVVVTVTCAVIIKIKTKPRLSMWSGKYQ
ncbi:MAG: hypothetical protein FWH37_01835 [Candidatus Bathyarchaeota archaeon]|nr:hypothetical protein [Candidatus Termiticorpusculum sp.]